MSRTLKLRKQMSPTVLIKPCKHYRYTNSPKFNTCISDNNISSHKHCSTSTLLLLWRTIVLFSTVQILNIHVYLVQWPLIVTCVLCLPMKTVFAIAKKIIGSESAKSCPAVQSWCEDNKVCRPNQKASQTYQQRAKRLLRNNVTDSENESVSESYNWWWRNRLL